MLTLNIINNSFKSKGETKYLSNFQKLFDFFAKQDKWKNLRGEINLVLIDNQEIQRLNKMYRNKNVPTDVLSFPYLPIEEIERNQDNKMELGEIFISKTKAIDDAKDLDLTLTEELNKLFVHGVLHILGYDHIDDNDFFEMKKNEDFILEAFQKDDIRE